MNILFNRRLPFSIGLFILLFVITWPLYQYISDVDGIGYAAVAHHYMDGNLKLAVNGFWNPLHSWLVIPFMKAGLSDWAAFKISNAVFAMGSLIVLFSFVNKFDLQAWLKTAIQFTSVIILLSYTYFELAADALLVFLLLMYFNLVKSETFFTSAGKNILAGILGALLYFAKSYGFPFFIFHFIVVHLFLNPDKKQAFKQLLFGFSAFFLLTFPWIYALHWKYDAWMIAFGKYNAHWSFKDIPASDPIIQPPPYEGSAAVWEDPWHVRKDNFVSVPFLTLLLHQIRVVLFNFQQWLITIHDLSFLSSAILLLSAVFYFFKKSITWLYLIITLLCLPAGYLLLHIETRFIWALSFIFLIAGGLLMQHLFSVVKIKKWQSLLIWLIFFGSFLLEPINLLKDKIYQHKEFFETVNHMNHFQIRGKFTSNDQMGESMVIAYLSNNSYYSIAKPTYSIDSLLKEIVQYQIQHYFFYYQTIQQKEEFMMGKIAARAKTKQEIQPGLIVFSFY